MEELHKQVRRAERRLSAERFVCVLGWCWTAALTLAAVIILVGKFCPLGLSDAGWVFWAVAAGLLAAVVFSIVSSRGGMAAAMEIDRRFRLKERVSSAMALSDEQRETEIGRALVEDAVRRVKRIDVSERFKPRPPRSLLYPIVPALLVFCIALFVSPAAAEKTKTAAADQAAVAEQVKKSAKTLEKKLAQKREMAKQKGLKEAEEALKLLQHGAKQLAGKSRADQKKALVKLNDLAKDLKKRRQEQGGAEQIKRQLGNLKGFNQGPADNFAKAVRRGDFNKAMEELGKLEEQLKAGDFNKDQVEQLSKQLDQMRDKLEKMCAAEKKAHEGLQKQIDELRMAGKIKEANKLQEQLDKLRMQAPRIERLEQLARQMQECSKCLKNGNPQDAVRALEAAHNSLEDLQEQLDELDMLDEAMQQLEQCRKAMCCKHCNGAGCELCQAWGDGGPKAGVGFGFREKQYEEQSGVSFRDSHVRQTVGQGPMSIAGFTDGPNKKGEVGEEIKKQLDEAKHSDTDPLTNQQIPRKFRESVNGYFSRLRGDR